MSIEWKTEKRKVNDLLPYEKNPRKITPLMEQELKKSLEKFNLMSIPVVDTTNRIISGHQRLRLLKILGRGDEQIDVRVPNRPLTEEEFVEANLRENKNQGEFDLELLPAMPIDILHEVGFTDFEIGIELKDVNIDNKDVETFVKEAEQRAKYWWMWVEFDSEETMQKVIKKLGIGGKKREMSPESVLKAIESLPEAEDA